ncbi:hypothetical protein DO97_12750 [Neosynechococcus sphagnicola sy1]|uniref:PIN domain-containing protein n=1 Tax=Neosynechococcus sphagnicola sy1 TaxID=1497020 RepID=A0A098TN21_9CYAN|nr:PIN domain-containing protein [Neosynechococcus sphagnicola]KGF73689.1 hypothetical protein DO97_12750 [Neosynechococcus sphagnicola sy1]
MKTIFADKGYWIALLYPNDDLHKNATQLTIEIMPTKIVTTELIFAELLNVLSRRGAQFRQAAVRLIDSVLEDPKLEVIPQTTQLFSDALRLYDQRPDQSWSHTNCASFCIMREQAMLEALAYVRHFEKAGFVALLHND